MRLTKLVLSKLYGTLNKEVSFKRDLNLLVGINGSGKTSVLNVVDWLLRPNLARLAVTPFESLALTFEHQNEQHTIEALKQADNLHVHLRSPKTEYQPLHVLLIHGPTDYADAEEVDAAVASYNGLGPDEKELPLWQALKALPRSTVITLERDVYAEAQDEIYYDPRSKNIRRSARIRARSPLSHVLAVAAERQAFYRSQVIELNDTLKAKMALSALRDPGEPMTAQPSLRITPRDIDRLEKKVTDYVSSTMKGVDVAEQTTRFFKRFKQLTSRTGSAEKEKGDQGIFWGMLTSQYRQIQDLAAAFDEFEQESIAAYERLKQFLDAINGFLRDSKKRIQFKESNNQLGFIFIDDKGVGVSGINSVSGLSSGEKQILILLTFLAFASEAEGIFVVDEPELSLHPKWQSEFLDAFLSVRPLNSQILIATHSPDIVGGHKDACVVLLP